MSAEVSALGIEAPAMWRIAMPPVDLLPVNVPR